MVSSAFMDKRLAIFDLDDTLVHSAPIWRFAEQEMLRRIGRDWTPALATQFKGLNVSDLAGKAKELLETSACAADLACHLREALIAGFNAQPLNLVEGAQALVKRVASSAWLAVASGSPREVIELALKRTQLSDYFHLVVSSEEVPRGKPHPDVFVETARRLGMAASQCLVFEDSLVGVQAAHRAGMACIICPSLPMANCPQGAWRRVDSWHEVTNEDLHAWQIGCPIEA